MNKDSPPSPAEQAAREIADGLMLEDWFGRDESAVTQCDEFAADIAPVIQQAIDRSVAETEEKYRKLANEFRELDDDTERRAQWAAGYYARRIESLIPKQEGEK